MKQLLITIASVLLMGCGSSIYEAAEEGKIEEVKQLLTDGADLNAKTDSYLETPLHYAAENGQKEVAQILINKSADINAKAKWDRTPLHGADLNPQDFENKTPLNEAIKYKHSEVAGILRKHGAKTGEELKAELS